MAQNKEKMNRGLKNRHLQMIALGGAIGTGLFYGSTSTIAMAGPAVILSYFIGGMVIFFIMRMLGEAVEEPVSGSFSYFATKYWGKFPGFLAGWNYWLTYIIVSMAELTAVGIYLNYWFPDLPQWVGPLICLLVITAINLVTVKIYGEVEFFMSMIKVTAICLMIILGLYILLSDSRPFPENFSNLWINDGFFPHGIWGMLTAIVPVMFSFGGIELIGITAGVPRAINQVIWRILIFYVGTMTILMSLWSWKEVGTEASPFVQIFENVGITAAANILNFVVLIAAISVYNSAIYSNSRMLYGLSISGEAPKFFEYLSERKVPVNGILFSSGITFLTVILNYLFPGQIFMYLLSLTTCAIGISWFMIVMTHLKFRQKYDELGKKSKFRSIGYPFTNYLCLAFLIGIAGLMLTIEGMSLAVFMIPLWIFVLRIGYKYTKYGESR